MHQPVATAGTCRPAGGHGYAHAKAVTAAELAQVLGVEVFISRSSGAAPGEFRAQLLWFILARCPTSASLQ